MLYVWDVCAGESSPSPSPPSCQYLSASASTGGWHEGTQKQTTREDCNFCATALFILFFDKIIACSDADAHTVFAASTTQSNWKLYSAAGVGVKRLGLTKFASSSAHLCSAGECPCS